MEKSTKFKATIIGTAVALIACITIAATWPIQGVKELRIDSDGNGTFLSITETSGTGNVVGPGASTDNAIARWDGTSGTALKNSGVTIGGAGANELNNVKTITGSVGEVQLEFKIGASDGLYKFYNGDGSTVDFELVTEDDQRGIIMRGIGSGGSNYGSLQTATLSVSRVWTFPDASGTVALTSQLFDPASPGAIGGTTAAAGTFTDLTSTGNTTIGNAGGDALTVNAAAPTFPNLEEELETTDRVAVFRSGTNNGLYYIAKEDFSGWLGAACPFVYQHLDGAWVQVGEIVRDKSSKAKEGTDTLILPVLDDTVQLRELKREVSYLDKVALVVSLQGGGREIMRPVNRPELAKQDGNYFIMREGEFLTLTFRTASGRKLNKRATMATLVVTGYYEPVR